MQKILITGELGQVGNYLVDRLCNTAEVTVLDNYSSTTRESVPEGVNVVRDDILSQRAYEMILQNEVIIHTVAQISVARSIGYGPKVKFADGLEKFLDIQKYIFEDDIIL